MPSKLSMDVLSIIFEDLERQNDKTLYSCIFVNREWCQVAIPFLWKNPWNKFDENCENYDGDENDENGGDENDVDSDDSDETDDSDGNYENDDSDEDGSDESDDVDDGDDDGDESGDYDENDYCDENGDNKQANRYKILFKCFLMMMPKESKEFLKMNGINLLIEDTYSSLQAPLFNYVSFCKVIDSFKINDMVNHNLKYSITDFHPYLVEQEILKLLIGNTSKLKMLMLRHKSHPITFFANSSISLSQLNELHCDTSIDVTIFYGLSQLSRNIERLVIEGYDDDNQGLIIFIKQQVNLKRVKIWGYEEENVVYSDTQWQCKNLGEALATKASSIIELDLGECVIPIPPTLLKKLQNNLIIFKFCVYREFVGTRWIDKFKNILDNISLPNLQQLIIYNKCPFDIIGKIIKNTNGELKTIDVGTYHDIDYYVDEDIDALISIITKHCPKLELLAIWIDDFDQILELIKECKKLRGLVLQSCYYEQSAVELPKILHNDASNQLKKLQLDSGWELSKEALNEFFENWNQQHRKPLDLYISSDIIDEEDEDVIKKYQELGVISKFEKYAGDHNFLDGQ